MPGSAVLIRKYLIPHRLMKVLSAVTRRRIVHILPELPVKAGQTAKSCLLGDNIDRFLIQVDQMTSPPYAVMLDILQGTDAHHLPKQPAEMALADTAAGRQLPNGNGFRIMLINIGKRRPNIKMCACQILRGTAFRIACQGQAVHFRTKRHK